MKEHSIAVWDSKSASAKESFLDRGRLAAFVVFAYTEWCDRADSLLHFTPGPIRKRDYLLLVN